MSKKRAAPPATMQYNLEETKLRENIRALTQLNLEQGAVVEELVQKNLAQARDIADMVGRNAIRDQQAAAQAKINSSLRKQVEAGAEDTKALAEAIECNKRLTDRRDELEQELGLARLSIRGHADTIDWLTVEKQNQDAAMSNLERGLTLYQWGFFLAIFGNAAIHIAKAVL